MTKEKTYKARYEVGTFFTYQETFFEVLELTQDFHYKCQECDIFGDRLDFACLLLHFSTKGMRKVKKKVDPVREDKKNTEFSRANHQEPEHQDELDPGVVLVDSPEFDHTLTELKKADEIGFDIETYGTERKQEAIHPYTGEIRLIQAYIPKTKKAIIWDLFKDCTGLHILLEKLQDDSCQVFIHNADFEVKWIWVKFGIWITNILDTRMLSQIYYAGCLNAFMSIGIKQPNSLRELVVRELGALLDKENQFYDYYQPVYNEQLNYAFRDAKYCYLSGKKLLEKCYEEELDTVIEAEMAAIPSFVALNLMGLPIDPGELEELLFLYSDTIDKIRLPWQKKFPGCNLNSHKQVLECFHIIGIETRDKTGKPCTDNPTLTEIALSSKDTELVELIDNLLLYRSVKKDIEYISGYQKAIAYNTHYQIPIGVSNYNQNATQCTGRTSSSKFNAQNIPKLTPKKEKWGLKSLRTAFKITDNENLSLVLVDLAGSHAQILRQLSQDPRLIEAHNSGIKLHFYTAAGILAQMGIEVAPEEIAKAKKDKTHWLWSKCDVNEIYNAAKTVWYGGQNLNGADTLQGSFLKRASMLKSTKVCKDYIQGWRDYFHVSYKYQRDSIRESNNLNRRLSVRTSLSPDKKVRIGVTGNKNFATAYSPLDKGRMFVEKFPSKYTGNWEAKGTDLVSYRWLRIEGTIMKLCMARFFWEAFFNPVWDASIWQMTHDELGVICNKKYELIVAERLNTIMDEEFRKFVPDYRPDSYDPKTCLINDWSEK